VELPEAAPPREFAPLAIDLRFVYEDEHLAVLDKPPGLVVHPAPGHWDDTLVNALVGKGVALSSSPAGRPGVVHRLDRDTSGLLVLAKSDLAHRRLAAALARRRVRRQYAALVWGHLDADPVVIDAPIARHPRDRKRMAVLAGGRAARSTAATVARFGVVDLVRLTLETGRTHQLRVHLAYIGHPVVGDPVYGGGGARRVSGPGRSEAETIERLAPRQALHAAELGFTHPITGEALLLRSEWPADLRPALAAADPDLLARDNPLEYVGFFTSDA
jgi:23S rRNA pseudouridine1911/1915/1917 synthase